MTNQIKSIAISGLNRGENPQPGPAVIASIRRRFPELRIVGLSYDPMESSLYSKGNDRPDVAYSMPYPGVGPEALQERLETIRQSENLVLILPCLDLEIPNYIAISAKLREWGIKCALPSQRSLESINKSKLYDFCQRLNVPAPQTISVMDQSSLERAAEEIGYPVYVKGLYYEAHIANTLQELVDASSMISRLWGWPILVQETIVGEEYDIAGLGDGKGGLTKTCSIRKFQRSAMGKGFAGIVVEDPELDKIVQSIIKELQWNGPFELEFIRAPGKTHALIEINPRFPAWIDFPSQIGYNLPGRLLEGILAAKQIPLRNCDAGQMFIRHCIDLVGDISDLAEMTGTGERIITS